MSTFVGDVTKAKVVTSMNLVIADIHERVVMMERSTFTTKAPTTTGTVSVTSGSAAVTFSGNVLAAADPQRRVRIGSSGARYTLTRLTDSTGTLSSVYDGATDTVATYEIVYPCVTYPVGVGAVHRVFLRDGSAPDLGFATNENAPGRAISAAAGLPLWRAPYVFDASSASPSDDLLREELVPPPDDDYTFTYVFSRRPANIATDAATSVVVNLPSMFDRALCYGVVRDLWAAVDKDERARPWAKRYEDAMAQALCHTSKGTPTQRQLPGQARLEAGAWQYPPSEA